MLEEGVEYVADGGYMSFMLVGDTLIVKGLMTEDDDNETATSIRIIVTDNSSGNAIKLRKKTIAVMK